MNPEQQLISDITVFSKYARYWHELGRRETYEEIVARNRQMHITHLTRKGKLTPEVQERIDWAYRFVADRKVFPSMRSMQFGGEAILQNNSRMFNCSFMTANTPEFFRELMFLLMSGTGVGYSVQRHHVNQLPLVTQAGSLKERTFIIPDSIEGWADAIDFLVSGYFYEENYIPQFDYSLIRPQGAILKTSGGKAPGPEPLRRTIEDLRIILDEAIGRKLTTVQVHDMACIIARAVLSGGIRRSAMISLFSPDDAGMLTAKSGDWWNVRSERAFANNSAVLLRGRDDQLFHEVFQRAQESGSGEPGIFWVDDLKYGTNPCAEITLNDMQYCNLTTINAGTITNQRDFNDRATAAAIIGTIQATYTNFHYLRPEWKRMTEQEALLGVSMTGIASGAITNLNAEEAASHAVAANDYMARLLGINAAARVTAVKPEGTASLVAGTSSGIHAWHDKFFIRRMRFNKQEAIAQYLMRKLPYRIESDDANPEIIEDDVFNPHQIVVAIPKRAPDEAVTRGEGALALLERVGKYNDDWIRPGNNYGGMTNNISATINIQDHEWSNVRRWMWNNRYSYNGLSLLPYSDHTYRQAPYQTITEATYNELTNRISACEIDLREVREWTDETSLAEQAACAGGACELPW
jgi:ribonucleoside-triphosphate reductase (thioredoxin)